MTCECKTNIEKRLLDKIKTDRPNLVDLKVDLGGYAFLFGADRVLQKPVLPVTVTHQLTAKSGSVRTKKESMSMTANFCPFCGVSLKDEPEAAS